MRAAAAEVSSAELRAGLAGRGSWGGVFAGDSPLSPALCAPPAGAVTPLEGLSLWVGSDVQPLGANGLNHGRAGDSEFFTADGTGETGRL